MLRSLQLAVLLLAPVVAHADGAFPDSLAIFAPADRAGQLLVATNFGLLVGDDQGGPWTYTCEEVIGTLAGLYQLGPAPADRLFAVSQDGLAVSSDTGCSWALATGPVGTVADAFPDPHDADHVLVIGTTLAAEGSPSVSALFASDDGGATVGDPLLAAVEGAVLTGVEVARTDARAVVVARYGDPSGHAVLLRSTDGGATFAPLDLSPWTGTDVVRVVAIDPADAGRVWLRALGASVDRLVLVDGDDVTVPLTLDGAMSAFLRRADGDVLVGAATGSGWRSRDAGATFSAWATGLHLRGLAERGGRLYAVADDVVDGFAVGVSDDVGATWTPLLRLKDLTGPQACGDLATSCMYSWVTLQNLFAFVEGDTDTGADDGPAPTCGCASSSPSAGVVVLILGALLGRRSGRGWRGVVGRRVAG